MMRHSVDAGIVANQKLDFVAGRCVQLRGVARGHNVPGAEKCQQRRKYFPQYNTLLPKGLRFEHRGATLGPGAI